MNKGELKAALNKTYKNLNKIAGLLLLLLIISGIIVFLIARNRIDEQTRRIAGDMENIYHDYLNVQVVLDETVPINFDLPLEDLVGISSIIPSEIPIDTNVPINTTVYIDELIKVPVTLPFGGTVMVDVPINTSVPIRQNIPISTTVEIDPSVFGTSDNIITIDKEIPLNIPMNLKISPADLGLAKEMENLTGLINTLRLVFLLRSIDINWDIPEQGK